jgi:hypothetical protein
MEDDMTDHTGNGASATRSPAVLRIDVVALGLSLSSFFVISYVLCIASGLIAPGWGLHQPWLQFFPGFEWLTLRGFLIGLVESVVYGWYVALVLGPLFNLFAARRGWGAGHGQWHTGGKRQSAPVALVRSCSATGRLS